MTKLYTLEELFTNNVIANSPDDFLKNENNIPKYFKEVFPRMASGEAINKVDELTPEELKQYNKDVTSMIYSPELLKLVWNYRLECINNNALNEETIQKYISEIYQYVEVYLKQIALLDSFEKGSSNVRPDYAFKPDWLVKAQNTIAKIKLDLNNLYIANKLPNTLLLSTNNNGIGILTTGFNGHGYDEVETTDALNRIGIKVNIDDLSSSKTR